MKLIGISLALLSVCLLMGCGSGSRLEGLVPAEGVVTLNGTPVDGASVVFAPKGSTSPSSSASAQTDAEGRFQMMTLNPGDGVYPGEYYVTVTKTVIEGEAPVIDPNDKASKKAVDTRTVTECLPMVYADITTSGLDQTIAADGNKNIEFKLTGDVQLKPRKITDTVRKK
ncbi:MAG: hypothetical protein PHE53_07795 [Thermoguttaceae bacterium]|nr:hypothetical protein [Thermoguttaceae bacterium]